MTRRLDSLDYLRLAAVLAVVVQHAGGAFFLSHPPSAGFLSLEGATTWNIPALFLVSGFLSGLWERRGSAGREKRLYRLLVPYASCSVLIGLVLALRTHEHGGAFHLPTVLDLLTGHGIYFTLWFLPMLTYCTVVAWPFRSPRLAAVAGGLFLSTWAILAVLLRAHAEIGYVVSTVGFLFHLPFFAGLYLLARGLGLGEPLDPASMPSTSLAIATASLLALDVVAHHQVLLAARTVGTAAIGSLIDAASAAALFALAVAVAPRFRPLPRFWASVAPLGIYLSHVFVLAVVERIFPIAHVQWFLWVPVAAAATVLGSALVVRVAVGVPLLRPVLGLPLAVPSSQTRHP